MPDIPCSEKPSASRLPSSENSNQTAHADTVLAALGDVISVQDPDFRILYQNQTSKEVYGDHAGEYCYRAYQQRDRVCEPCHLAMTFADGRHHALEHSRTLNGETRYYEVTFSPVKDSSGRIVSGIELVRDITERRRADQEIKDMNTRLQTLLDALPDTVFFKDAEGRYLSVNRAFEENMGIRKGAAIGKTVEDFLSRDIAERCMASDTAVINNGVPVHIEDVLIAKNGKKVYLDSIKVPIRDSRGNRMGLVVVSRDVSERRRSEEEILRLGRQKELILHSAGEGIYGLDCDGRITFINPAAAAMLGASAEELVGRPSHETFHHSRPDGSPYPREECPFHRALPVGAVHRVRDEVFWRKDGTSFPIEYVSNPLMEEERVVGAVVVFRDISERKQAEVMLKVAVIKAKDEKAKADAIISSMGDFLVIIDPSYRIVFQNQADRSVIGNHVGEVCYRAFEKRATVCEGCPAVTAFRDGRVHRGERIAETRVGTRHLDITASPVRDDAGKIVAVIEMIRDVTERRKMEEALRQSERRLRAIFDYSAVGIAIINRQRKVVLTNPAIERMLGYDNASLRGREVAEFSHPEDDKRNMRLYDELMEGTRDYFQIEKRYRKKDGTIIWGQLTMSAIQGAGDKPEFAVAMVEDISDRKRSEQLMQRSREELETLVRERTAELTMLNEQLRNLSRYLQDAREEERTMIAREIHDELGQSLTALKMDLSLLSRRLPKDLKPVLEKTKSMAGLIESTIQSVKRISTELRPGILDHLGLPAAIEWQAGEFQKRSGIPCTVETEPDDIAVDRDRSTTVFRVFQETLTNIARHARATKVSVSLKQQADELVLHVRDDGRGITPKQMTDPGSLGLIGMRERVHYWGGSLTISGTRNKGTAVAVRLPLDGREAAQ